MDITIDSFITQMEVKFDKTYTDEQRDFIRDITKPVFVFASPGTGKTQSAVGALIAAELYHKVPGANIYALSFTRKATSELKVRHEIACKKLGIKQRVNFSTLHKLCSDILSENANALDIMGYQVGEPLSPEEMHSYVLMQAEEHHIPLPDIKVRDFLNAIKTLNSTLTFDAAHVQASPDFLRVGISFDDFTLLRHNLYEFNKTCGIIPVSSIQIYTLELLLKHPEVAQSMKDKCKIMLVDEAQDLSLLQLGLVNSFTQCPVLIGDQKQQIYGFQGACPEIKAEYFRLHPEARELTLSHSFRCKNNIADYATPLILKNKVGGEEFTGCGEGGIVEEVPGMDVASICEALKEDFINNKHMFTKEVLFLYRNNYSAMPLIEELYMQHVPFRSYKYPGATEIPFVKELCQIVDFLRNPSPTVYDGCLRYLIPEFRGVTGPTPLSKVARELGCSPLEVNYAFKNEYVGARAMEALVTAEDMIKSGRLLSDIFNTLWPVLYETYGNEKEKYTDKPAKYYLALAAPVVRGKTYNEFIHDEQEKMKLLDEYENKRLGVRCYTMHAAKGLEADIVHIIDADEGTIPNDKILDRLMKRKCYDEAAKQVRAERSLVYVAATRAREELYIHYSHVGTIAPLFRPNDSRYDKLDAIYEGDVSQYDDIDAFKSFTKGGV